MIRVCDTLQVSQRRACRVLGQHRSTQPHRHMIHDEEKQLTGRVIELATMYGRYGYRLITGLLRNEGWKVHHKRVERIWRREGLKVPKKQPKRGRLWLNDGSCIRLRPQHKGHVWSYDLMTARTHEGKAFRILNILDEYTRECLDITVERGITSHQVIERLAHLSITRGIPEHIRFRQRAGVHGKGGTEVAGKAGGDHPLHRAGKPLKRMATSSRSTGSLRDELLNGEIFTTLLEAKVLIENWKRAYNTIRPHSSLRYKPPAPEAMAPFLNTSLIGTPKMIERLTLGVVQ